MQQQEDRAISGPPKTDTPQPGWSIRSRLSLLVLLVSAAMLLLAVAVVLKLAASERTARLEALTYAAKSVQTAVDTELEKLTSIGRALAVSPSLERNDFATFRREAEQAVRGLKGVWIVVADPAGQQIFNLAVPSGAPLPKRAPEGVAAQTRAFESKKPEISNVYLGAYTKKSIVTVDLPSFRDGAPQYVVAVSI